MTGITRAGAGDAGRVAGLIGAAFHPLAVSRWLVPDPARRSQLLPANVRIFVDHALVHGEVQVTGDRSGAAVWFPRDRSPVPEPVDYPHRLAAACGEATGRFDLLDELFEQHHPAAPHHHLALLAVHPDHQRRGLGSALLAHQHARLDAQRVAAYLEASSEASRDLYLRHGYQLLGAPFELPDGSPFWPMWRSPG